MEWIIGDDYGFETLADEIPNGAEFNPRRTQ